MVSIGYTIMGEQSGPKQLVDDAVRAEAAGFEFLAASDHYNPKKFVDAGFTHVALVQIGGENQSEFLEWSQSQLLPALRSLR